MNKPTVFNYRRYKELKEAYRLLLEENKELKHDMANLEIRCRIAEAMVKELNGGDMYAFGMARCIEGGTVKGHTFKVGEIYPILGLNNGVQIGYTVDEEHGGDMAMLLCHTWDCFAPIEGEQFCDQDGTIPPRFVGYDAKKGEDK